MSGSERFVGRVGALAVALGVGALTASVPWLASADTQASAADMSALFVLDPSPAFDPAASDPFNLDIEVSYDGKTLFELGDGASASSAHGGFAVAIGDGSAAEAGSYTSANGTTYVGDNDFAFAYGSGSTAVATGGHFNYAMATDGATAHAGVFDDGMASGNGGDFDTATASGSGSLAESAFGSQNSATALNGGTADAGFFNGDKVVTNAGFGGSGNVATADGNGSLATAFGGFDNTARAYGEGSHAYSGGFTGNPPLNANDDNYAAALHGSTANATGYDGQTVISPFLDGSAPGASDNPIDTLFSSVDKIYSGAEAVLKEAPSGLTPAQENALTGQAQFIDMQQQLLDQIQTAQQTQFTSADPDLLADIDKVLFKAADGVFNGTTEYSSAVFLGQDAGSQFEALLTLAQADLSASFTDLQVLFNSGVAELFGYLGLSDLLSF